VPVDRVSGKVPFVQMLAYRRAPSANAKISESGEMDYAMTIQDATGVLGWRGVDGGLLYLTGNHQLHFLRGAKP